MTVNISSFGVSHLAAMRAAKDTGSQNRAGLYYLLYKAMSRDAVDFRMARLREFLITVQGMVSGSILFSSPGSAQSAEADVPPGTIVYKPSALSRRHVVIDQGLLSLLSGAAQDEHVRNRILNILDQILSSLDRVLLAGPSVGEPTGAPTFFPGKVNSGFLCGTPANQLGQTRYGLLLDSGNTTVNGAVGTGQANQYRKLVGSAVTLADIDFVVQAMADGGANGGTILTASSVWPEVLTALEAALNPRVDSEREPYAPVKYESARYPGFEFVRSSSFGSTTATELVTGTSVTPIMYGLGNDSIASLLDENAIGDYVNKINSSVNSSTERGAFAKELVTMAGSMSDMSPIEQQVISRLHAMLRIVRFAVENEEIPDSAIVASMVFTLDHLVLRPSRCCLVTK